jgi:hypothetical protein
LNSPNSIPKPLRESSQPNSSPSLLRKNHSYRTGSGIVIDTMSLEHDITDFLRRNGDTKAKDIAAGIGAEKGDVNRVLYVERGHLFRVDGTFKWSLIINADLPTPTAAEVPTSVAETVNSSHQDILQARLTIARLKRGVPPAERIDVLAVGMDRLDRRLHTLLGTNPQARWSAVIGEYGEGKSFFRAYACQRALSAGYAVASLDINKDEGALHQPQRHLPVVVRSLQSPLPSLRMHLGIADVLRQWIATTPPKDVSQVLHELMRVLPWSPAGREPAQFRFLVESALNTTKVLSQNGQQYHDPRSSTVLVDSHGFTYKRAEITGNVYRCAPGTSDWHLFGRPDSWELALDLCRTYPSRSGPEPESTAPRSFSALISFLAFENLAFKSTAHRFQAQYRFQLLVDWLRLIGHKGLFLFIDELDNVVRQIHVNGHAGCFRTLAWYCAAATLPNVRVVFATTPEVMHLLDNGCREAYLDRLITQYSTRPEESDVYNDWNAQANIYAKRGWDHCPALQPEQRIELFHRIRALHDIAWGPARIPSTMTLERLAVMPGFETTRRWVRASVKLLDLLKQQH